MLGQSSQLNSLHWFQSIKTKHHEDRKKLEKQKTIASKEDEKFQQTLALTEKRLNAFENVNICYFYIISLTLNCFRNSSYYYTVSTAQRFSFNNKVFDNHVIYVLVIFC